MGRRADEEQHLSIPELEQPRVSQQQRLGDLTVGWTQPSPLTWPHFTPLRLQSHCFHHCGVAQKACLMVWEQLGRQEGGCVLALCVLPKWISARSEPPNCSQKVKVLKLPQRERDVSRQKTAWVSGEDGTARGEGWQKEYAITMFSNQANTVYVKALIAAKC